MTETTTEWAVRWPADTNAIGSEVDTYEQHDESEARRVAAMWSHAGAVLVRRTVTRGEWTS